MKDVGNDPQDAAPAIEHLFAEGPDIKHKEELMLFGKFAGDWNILEDKSLNDEGNWNVTGGELHWGWILDGLAVQDVWEFTDNETGKSLDMGTTIRFYNSEINAWNSVWASPTQRVIKTFIGRNFDDGIVLDAQTGFDHPVRWFFYNVTQDGFQWRAEEHQTEDEPWIVVEEMKIRRIVQNDPMGGKIKDLLSAGSDIALEEKLMAFGRFVGDWKLIKGRYFQVDGTWKVVHGESHWGWILGGKALQNVWKIYDSSTGKTVQNGTAVRFYDSVTDSWKGVGILPASNSVIQFSGKNDGSNIVLTYSENNAEARCIYSDISEGSFRWKIEHFDPESGTWNATMEFEVKNSSGK